LVRFIRTNLFTANAQQIVGNANAANPGQLVSVQAFIWVPIILTLILLSMTCMMMYMDGDKSRDTILYAKFISNVKDK
jgi:hypothetical protein